MSAPDDLPPGPTGDPSAAAEPAGRYSSSSSSSPPGPQPTEQLPDPQVHEPTSYPPPSGPPPQHYPPQQYPPPPGYGYPPPPPGYGYPPPGYGAVPGYPARDPAAPWGRHPITGEPYSDKQKIVAGLLQIFVGTFGAGRFYLGYNGIAVAQLLTCGGLGIWALIDGIMILTGSVRDPHGRPLRD